MMRRNSFVATAAFAVLMGIAAFSWARATEVIQLRTMSSRPDTVSGADVLVEVNAPASSRWSVQLNGHDVTPAFRAAAGSSVQIALLVGLKPGKNILEGRIDDRARSRLELFNYPRSGPIFSGPHQKPFICQTELNGLGPALDADCDAKTVVQYYYKSTEPTQTSPGEYLMAVLSGKPRALEPGFKVYPVTGPMPSDIAQTIISDGRAVPYIVRHEIGVINRAIYDIRILHQPGEPLPTPWSGPTPGWNGRLVYLFGGGWGASYRQGVLQVQGAESFLAEGYAVATSSLNVFGNESNHTVAAETLSMVKEHFTEEYGVPVHTIGSGGSGGSMEQHLIAQNYPGLLDGLVVSGSFPDALTTIPTYSDCALLGHAFETSMTHWTPAQKSAVSGFATWRTCLSSWGIEPPILNPANCDASIPQALRYDRSANPNGARCDLFGNQITVVGRDPRTGFANRALDNIGVQYGLIAFNAGKIDAEHFLELNERMGGFDPNGNFMDSRMEASEEALRIAYARGLVLTGHSLDHIPIIDWRLYSDDLADEHDLVRSFTTRARLIRANGAANNQVIIVYARDDIFSMFSDPQVSSRAQRQRELVRKMDYWLENIASDTAPGSTAQKVARGKPADLADGCVTTDGEIIVETASRDGAGRCSRAYPSHGNPRIASGSPLADDVLKCALKPVSAADYVPQLSPDQLSRLQAIFPQGVCDYGRPGIGQEGRSASRTTTESRIFLENHRG